MQKKNDWENLLQWNFDEVQVWMFQNQIVVAEHKHNCVTTNAKWKCEKN
jgi:hypothetical protein